MGKKKFKFLRRSIRRIAKAFGCITDKSTDSTDKSREIAETNKQCRSDGSDTVSALHTSEKKAYISEAACRCVEFPENDETDEKQTLKEARGVGNYLEIDEIPKEGEQGNENKDTEEHEEDATAMAEDEEIPNDCEEIKTGVGQDEAKPEKIESVGTDEKEKRDEAKPEEPQAKPFVEEEIESVGTDLKEKQEEAKPEEPQAKPFVEEETENVGMDEKEKNNGPDPRNAVSLDCSKEGEKSPVNDCHLRRADLSEINYEIMKVVRANFSQRDIEPRFAYAGAQCTSNCLEAIRHAGIAEPLLWKTDHLDHILRQGNRLHSTLKDVHHLSDNPDDRIGILDIPDTLFVSLGTDLLHIQKFGDTMYGQIDGSRDPTFGVVDLKTAIESVIFNNQACSRGLLTVGEFTFAVMRDAEDFLWLFDSHMRGIDGLVDTEGTSVLLKFSCIQHLIRHLVMLFNSGSVMYELQGVGAFVL